MLTRDLGPAYVFESYRGRWFRRELDGKVYRLDNMEATVGRRNERESTYVLQCSPLISEVYADTHWGEPISIPDTEFTDMSVFSNPDLGYRHTPNGAGLYYFTRRISTHRGLHNSNLECTAVARASNSNDLTSEKKVALVYNMATLPMIEAVTLLNNRGASVRGFAITPQFAISRKTGDRNTYSLHYNGRAAGTCTNEGVATFNVHAVKRLFDKVA